MWVWTRAPALACGRALLRVCFVAHFFIVFLMFMLTMEMWRAVELWRAVDLNQLFEHDWNIADRWLQYGWNMVEKR